MNEMVPLTGSRALAISPAIEEDDSGREFRLGLIVAALFFIGFLGWAAFAPLDAAANAGGQLIVSGQRQTVQHRDGGVVEAIRVREGQHVQKGQVLIELAGAEVRAEERALATQMINLEAERARLEAEQAGARSISWPAYFADPQHPSRAMILNAMRAQLRNFQAGIQLLSAQSQVLGQQVRQSQESAAGYRSMMQSSAEQERLIDEELESLRPVAEKGFVSTSRIRAMERAKAELQGRRSGFEANAAEARAAAGANQLRRLEAERAYRERASNDLRQVVAALSELQPKYRAAYERAERLLIRAPATGTVLGLSIFTVGGVITPGTPILDVVPDRVELVIAARFPVEDADDLKVGQEAQIRFTGLPSGDLPILNGRLERVSADSFVDEKSGVAYYTAELRVPPSELETVRRSRDDNVELKPGMPVEVIVPLRKRTALQYAFEPLWATMRKAFLEH
jgi:HlyD family secretion protein